MAMIPRYETEVSMLPWNVFMNRRSKVRQATRNHKANERRIERLNFTLRVIFWHPQSGI
jgi:hypothetical protein